MKAEKISNFIATIKFVHKTIPSFTSTCGFIEPFLASHSSPYCWWWWWWRCFQSHPIPQQHNQYIIEWIMIMSERALLFECSHSSQHKVLMKAQIIDARRFLTEYLIVKIIKNNIFTFSIFGFRCYYLILIRTVPIFHCTHPQIPLTHTHTHTQIFHWLDRLVWLIYCHIISLLLIISL